MKLATLQDGSRDGRLVVVSRDLKKCKSVPLIAETMQEAIDRWQDVESALRAVAADVDAGRGAGVENFAEEKTLSPLPRAYQFLDGSAYLNHVELVRKARGATVPESFYSDPLMYQGGSDGFLAPRGLVRGRADWGIDFEAEVAVVVGEVPLGASSEEAIQAIRLVLLMNDVSLRELLRTEITKELGFVQSKPASAFSPVAVTPDELGPAWRGGRLYLPLTVHLNDHLFGHPNAGQDMNFDFGQLVAHAARTRDLGAGTIVGGGTVSNKQDHLWGSSIGNGGVGYCCLAELRMYEIIESGSARTPFMTGGDRVRIEMFSEDGVSIFGAIENKVALLDGASG